MATKKYQYVEIVVLVCLILAALLAVICYFGRSVAREFRAAAAQAVGDAAGARSSAKGGTSESMASQEMFSDMETPGTKAGYGDKVKRSSSPSFRGHDVKGYPQQVGASVVSEDPIVPPDGGSSMWQFFSPTNSQRKGRVCRPGEMNDDF